MQAKAFRMLFIGVVVLFAIIGFSGCGGGGGSDSSSVTPAPPAVAKDATITMTGGVIEASAGANVSFLVNIDCPRVSAGSTRCAKVVGPLSLSASGGTLLHSFMVSMNGIAVDPSTWNITDAGQLQVSATVALGATVGNEVAVALSVTNSGQGTVEVVGTPTVVRVVQSAAKIASASTSTFSKSGYGEIGGFDLTCPADTAPLGCRLNGMTEFVAPANAAAAKGVQVDTFIGQTFWWQYELGLGQGAVVSGGEEFIMNSPLPIAAGATVRVSLRSMLSQGSLFFTRVELVRVKDGTNVPLLTPAAPGVCSTVVRMLAPASTCA